MRHQLLVALLSRFQHFPATSQTESARDSDLLNNIEVTNMFSHVLKASALAAVVVLATSAYAADAPAGYTKTVMEQVSSKVEYPKMAKMRHQEGAAVVLIQVDAKGAPTNATIEKSSGFESLDSAALAAVQAAAPFPAPAEGGATVHGAIRFAAE
jgi:TonB family protein